MVATLLAPTSGAVLIGGRDVSSLSEREASHFRLAELGFVRQNFDLLPGVSAIDNAVLKLLKDDALARGARARRAAARAARAGRAPEPPLRDAVDGRAPARDDRARAVDRAAACCSPTSRPAASTPSAGAKCSNCCASSAASARWRSCSSATTRRPPRYADRVLALRDGKLSSYRARAGLAPAPRVRHRVRAAQRPAPVPRAPARARCCRSASRSSASPPAWRCCSPPRSPARACRAPSRSSSRDRRQRDAAAARARPARLRRAARSRRCARSAGVRAAAPLLEASAQAQRPRGSESVELIGADRASRSSAARSCAHTLAEPVRGHRRGRAARAAGAPSRGRQVRRGSHLQADGQIAQAPLYEQLRAAQIGPLIDSPIAVAPL